MRRRPIRSPRAIFMRCGCCPADMKLKRSRRSCRSRRAGFGRCSNATTRAVPRCSVTNASTTAKPTILTPEALAALKERIKAPPADGGLWSGPKIARWLAKFHGVRSVHDQRGWDALIAIGYSIQQPRPRHPDAATDEDRAALKKSSRPRLTRSGVNIRAQASKSGRWMNTASA